MKYRIIILIILLLVFFACTACNKSLNSQIPEASNSAEAQVTQTIQVPIASPSITEEAQQTANNSDAIAKEEVLSFLNGNNGFAPNMLLNHATDLSDLKQVMVMILPTLCEKYHKPISFDIFNDYTKKYINKTYSDSDFSILAANKYGIKINMDKRVLYLYGTGSEKISLRNVDIIENDTALLTCSWGFICDEPENVIEISYHVQFGRENTQLYIKNITKQVHTTNNNSQMKAEILAFFNDDNEFATKMLQYPAPDMNDLEQVIFMIVYPLGGDFQEPISFDVFNEYAKKYINKTYADSEFAKYATDENVAGNNVVMGKRVLYLNNIGGLDLLIKSVEIIGNDSALLTCSFGTLYEPEAMLNVSFKVQFGRADSQLYIKGIWKTDTRRISNRFPKLERFEKCLWKINIVGNARTAVPSSYWIKGFIFLDSETLSKYKAAYQWTDMPDDWQPSLDTEVLETKQLKWSNSDAFDSFIIPSSYVGHLYIDFNNGILFFDVYENREMG